MSDEAAMVKWRIVYPILKLRPMISSGELLKALEGQISKSYLNDLLNVYAEKGLIHRIRSFILLTEVFEQKEEASFGFWRWLKYRDEKKQQKIQEHTNRIKVLLKQMYGNASFPLEDFDSYEELEDWFLSVG